MSRFAAPFIGQLGHGHIDGVYSLAKDSRSLTKMASGSADGVVKVWDLGEREERWSTQGHDGNVRSLCFTKNGQLLTCASDRQVKLWDCDSDQVKKVLYGHNIDFSHFKLILVILPLQGSIIIEPTTLLQLAHIR